MQKNKVIFLDRDGTINKDFGYVYETDKLIFIDGVIEGLKKLIDNGYKLIIITNQSGIGRGFYTEDDFLKFNDYMLNELLKKEIIIDKVYYCKHVDEDNCECRKPKLKLFYQAITDCNIDLSKSYAVGDKERDLAICKKTKVTGILIGYESEKYIFKSNLLEAVNYIVENEK